MPAHRILSPRTLGWTLVASLAASAPPALAGESTTLYNLLWDDCGLGAYSTNHMDACDSDGPPPHRLVLSILPGAPMGGFLGAQGVIEVASSGATIPDWWQLYAGGCRELNVTGDVHVGILNPPFTCASAWEFVSAGGAVQAQPGPSPDRLRIIWFVATPDSMSLDPAVASEFYLMAFNISRNGTTTCAGCEEPASIAAIDVRLTRHGQDPRGDVFATQAQVAPFITWQGGPTPARNRTWGEVKQLYR